MSFISIQIDPSTKDYVNLNGQIANNNSLECRIYQLLKTKRSKWLYAPNANYGSELDLLSNKRGQPNKTQLTQIVKSALEPLTLTGDLIITGITVPKLTLAVGSINIYGVDGEGRPVHFSLPPLI